jgi:hypothetical protein
MKWSPLTGIDSYSDSGDMPKFSLCVPFCHQWHDSNKEQIEVLTNQKISEVYCKTIAKGKYELCFQIGKNRVINWFGSACCKYSARAKAYQSYFDECY